MASCATQIFKATSAQWGCLKAKAAAEGFPLTSDIGSASRDGFTVEYAYDAASQQLSITCTESPFWAPCGLVNGKIHEVIDGTGCLSK